MRRFHKRFSADFYGAFHHSLLGWRTSFVGAAFLLQSGISQLACDEK